MHLHSKVLDISENNHLTNDILPSLEGFTSLKELYLSFTGLDSDIHTKELCSTLLNLEVLDLSRSNFNGSDIGFALSGLSSLKSLNLGSCQLTPRLIFNISKLGSLEIPFNSLGLGSVLMWQSFLKIIIFMLLMFVI